MSLSDLVYSIRQEERTMNKLLSVSEAAQYLGIKKTTVYKYVIGKRIPHVKIGTRVLFDALRLEAWVKEHSHEPESKAGNGAKT